MDRDTLIFIAFCVFILLVIVRFKQDRRQGKNTGSTDDGRLTGTESAGEYSERSTGQVKREKWRRLFAIIQLVVLGGLIIYMIPVLGRGFMAPGEMDMMDIFLRCLIFVFTIYIFIAGCLRLLRRKNKEEAGK